jgi:hypothetical protein
VSREAWLGAQDLAGRIYRQRVDADRLSDGDIARLCDLAARISIPFGVDLDKLSRSERGDLERLVARGAGLDGDHFDRQRKEAVMAEQTAQAAAKKRRMSFTRREQTNLFRTLFDEMMEQDIWADDAAIVCLVLTQFAAGRPFSSSASLEGEGANAVLVLDARMGLLGAVDGQGMLDGWYERCLFLAEAEQGWLAIDRAGPIWRIRLGPKLKSALDPTGTEVAA